MWRHQFPVVYEAASDAEDKIRSDGEDLEQKRLRVALSDDYIEAFTLVEAEASSDDESIKSDTESWLERTA